MTVAHVVCDRVASSRQPAGSVAVDCRGCGVPLWFDLTDADLVDVDEVRTFCTTCAPTDIPVAVTPSQLARLRAQGATDLDLAHVLALVTLANGNDAAARSLMAEIKRNPRGPTAVEYRNLRAEAFVHLVEARP
jgi:hypothetical protein